MGRGAGGLRHGARGLFDDPGSAGSAYTRTAGQLQGAARVCIRRRSAADRAWQGAAFSAERTGGRTRVKIAVLGGGNGSFAAAGDFSLQGHDLRLWRRDAAAVAAHRAAGSRILVKDARGS